MEHNYLFETDKLFDTNDRLVEWARERATTVNTYLIITRYRSKRTSSLIVCYSWLRTWGDKKTKGKS